MIEFRCQQCESLLRTPDGTEGKQAKCPQCGSLMQIPTPASSPPPREPEFRQAGPVTASTVDSANPFRSPQATDYAGTATGTVPRQFRPTQIEFGATFDRTWQLYKANFGMLVGGVAMIVLLMFIIDQIVQRLFGTNPQRFLIGYEFDFGDAPRSFRQAIGILVTQGIHAYFWIGLIDFTLKIARGEAAALADLFGAGPLFLPGLIVHWVVVTSTAIGLVFCFLPGLWVSLTFGLSLYMLVDQRTNITESFSYSYRAMRGNKLVLLGLWITMLGLSMLIGIFTCGLGLVVVVPFGVLLMSVVYLGVTGQLPAGYGQPAPYTTPEF